VPALFLYEPRMLLRTVVTHLIADEHAVLNSSLNLVHLTENVQLSIASNKILLVGIAGAGSSVHDLLRLIRDIKSLKVKTLVWLPSGFPWMLKILYAVYAESIISEENLATALLPALRDLAGRKPTMYRQYKAAASPRRITMTELDILLQFASGLSSREMAAYRQCSYKTIFSWKHNICAALNIENHAQWLEMLTEIVQLTSMYKAGKNYGSL
jgi:DNA-binding CsgD family transcriptional regulator